MFPETLFIVKCFIFACHIKKLKDMIFFTLGPAACTFTQTLLLVEYCLAIFGFLDVLYWKLKSQGRETAIIECDILKNSDYLRHWTNIRFKWRSYFHFLSCIVMSCVNFQIYYSREENQNIKYFTVLFWQSIFSVCPLIGDIDAKLLCFWMTVCGLGFHAVVM